MRKPKIEKPKLKSLSSALSRGVPKSTPRPKPQVSRPTKRGSGS